MVTAQRLGNIKADQAITAVLMQTISTMTSLTEIIQDQGMLIYLEFLAHVPRGLLPQIMASTVMMKQER